MRYKKIEKEEFEEINEDEWKKLGEKVFLRLQNDILPKLESNGRHFFRHFTIGIVIVWWGILTVYITAKIYFFLIFLL